VHLSASACARACKCKCECVCVMVALLRWNLRSPSRLDVWWSDVVVGGDGGLALAVAGVANVVQPVLMCDLVAGVCC